MTKVSMVIKALANETMANNMNFCNKIDEIICLLTIQRSGRKVRDPNEFDFFPVFNLQANADCKCQLSNARIFLILQFMAVAFWGQWPFLTAENYAQLFVSMKDETWSL